MKFKLYYEWLSRNSYFEQIEMLDSERFSSDEDKNFFTAMNHKEKRCMFEIVNVPRFVEINSRRRNGSDERLWRILLAIARRMVKWFAIQEINST